MCAATIQTVTPGQPAAGQRRQNTRAQSAPCEPAGSTSHGPRTAGVANTIQELASIRRRLNHPEPGTVNTLRARQRMLLHAILINPASSNH